MNMLTSEKQQRQHIDRTAEKKVIQTGGEIKENFRPI